MVADFYLTVPLFVLLRFQKWDDVLATDEPETKMVVSNALWHYARTFALDGKGQRQQALAEKAVFEKIRRKIPADTTWMPNSGEGILSLASLVLDARLADDSERAIEIWKKAVKAQDALAYDDPPPWYYPVRESLGAALFRAGNAAEAETVFRECLSRNPRDPRALFGLLETLKAEKKMDAAEWVHREFESSWKAPELQLDLKDF